MEIRLNNITFSYNSLEIIKDITHVFESGKLHSIVGESGCGKSTLLRLISSLISPSTGNISIDGKKPAELVSKNEIAFMFQDPTLLRKQNSQRKYRIAISDYR